MMIMYVIVMLHGVSVSMQMLCKLCLRALGAVVYLEYIHFSRAHVVTGN